MVKKYFLIMPYDVFGTVIFPLPPLTTSDVYWRPSLSDLNSIVLQLLSESTTVCTQVFI